jgi:hypothetical protein
MKLSCQLIAVVALVTGIYGQQNMSLGQIQQSAISELNNLLPSGQAQSVINSLQNQFMGPTGGATTIPTQSGQANPIPTSAASDGSGGDSSASTADGSGDSSAASTTDGSGSSASTSTPAVTFANSQGSNGEITSPIKHSYIIAGTLFTMVGSLLI